MNSQNSVFYYLSTIKHIKDAINEKKTAIDNLISEKRLNIKNPFLDAYTLMNDKLDVLRNKAFIQLKKNYFEFNYLFEYNHQLFIYKSISPIYNNRFDYQMFKILKEFNTSNQTIVEIECVVIKEFFNERYQMLKDNNMLNTINIKIDRILVQNIEEIKTLSQYVTHLDVKGINKFDEDLSTVLEEYCPNLKSLQLCRRVKKFNYTNLNLIDINLENNETEELNLNCPNLKTINISLSKFNIFSLVNYHCLEKIVCNFNGLHHIDNSGNKIHLDMFKHLNLKHLSILNHLYFEVGRIKTSMISNRLSELGIYSDVPIEDDVGQLTVLNLVSKVCPEILCENITKISLKANSLDCKNLKHCKKLDHASISVSDVITNLNVLDLSKVTFLSLHCFTLPDRCVFDELPCIEELDFMNRNNYEHGENTFAKLKTLKKLNLNGLLHSNTLRGLNNLRELRFNSFRGTSLPENAFHDLTSLERLELPYFNFKSLPKDIFKNLFNLKFLFMFKVHSAIFDNDLFQNQLMLENVKMHLNGYSDKIKFDNTPSLKQLQLIYLEMDRNEFNNDFLTRIPNLEVLDISGAFIFGKSSFSNIPKLREIRVRGFEILSERLYTGKPLDVIAINSEHSEIVELIKEKNNFKTLHCRNKHDKREVINNY